MPEVEVGTPLRFENEQGHVWEFLLARGEEIGAHGGYHDGLELKAAR